MPERQNILYPKSRNDLHTWLQRKLLTTTFPVLVVIYKKSSKKQTLTYGEVLEEAICYGLIDTQTKGIDADQYAIYLRKRQPGSNWTPANREIAQKMIAQNKMTDVGRQIYMSNNF